MNIDELIFDNKNFNLHTAEGMALIERSLREHGAGRSVLIDKDNRLIGGNGVVEAAKAVGINKVKVVEVEGDELVAVKRKDVSLDSQQGRAMALADNATAAADLSWDEEAIRAAEKNFNISADEWGIDFGSLYATLADDEEGDDGAKVVGKGDNEVAERYLDEAMVENVCEFIQQIDHLRTYNAHWLMPSLTLGAAKAEFIKAKFLGHRYKTRTNIYFTPERFFVGSKKQKSVYALLKKISQFRLRDMGGVAGLRTISNDALLSPVIFSTQYPIAGSRLCLDFPASIARELFSEFGGGDVLDPCHGWGGRLVGAMLADVKSYTGYDPSPVAHRGVNEIFDAFREYSETQNVDLFEECFEDADVKAESYDMALTSPPYFDVELYDGDNTSTTRYTTYDAWRDNFYAPLISKTFNALRSGGIFLLQVGSQQYPLSKDGHRIALECGFTVEGWRPLRYQNNLHGTAEADGEIILLLRKKNRDK